MNELHDSTPKEDWSNETLAYFVGHYAKKHKWNEFFSGEIDFGNEEITNFVTRIHNIITNGQKNEKLQNQSDEADEGVGQPREEKKYSSDLSEETGSDEPGGPGGREGGDRGEVRFSLSGDGTVEEYIRAVNMTGRTFNVGGREVKPGLTRYNFQEAFQDAILSVKKLQQVVERHFGIKLPTRENAWMYENRLSSINMHERKSFVEKVYEPMMKIADAIMKRSVEDHCTKLFFKSVQSVFVSTPLQAFTSFAIPYRVYFYYISQKLYPKGVIFLKFSFIFQFLVSHIHRP